MLRLLALVSSLAALPACGTQETSVEEPTDEVTGEISRCPQLVEPGPHFCQDGTIVVLKDESGCPYYACQR